MERMSHQLAHDVIPERAVEAGVVLPIIERMIGTAAALGQPVVGVESVEIDALFAMRLAVCGGRHAGVAEVTSIVPARGGEQRDRDETPVPSRRFVLARG